MSANNVASKLRREEIILRCAMMNHTYERARNVKCVQHVLLWYVGTYEDFSKQIEAERGHALARTKSESWHSFWEQQDGSWLYYTVQQHATAATRRGACASIFEIR